MKILLAAMRLAFRAVLRNKTRSALTILGIFIGVSAVVTVTALAEGASKQVGGSIDSFASNAIYVQPKPTQSSGARAKSTGRLTENDGRAIQREAVSVSGVGFWLNTIGQAVYEDKNVSTSLIGTNLPYFPIRKFKIDKGDLWQDTDEQLKTKVCVIGSTVRDKLLGSGVDPIGRTLRIGGFPYRVIGLLESRGTSTFGDDQDDRIFMPIGSYRARIQHTAPGRVDQFIIGATSEDTVERATSQIESILRQRHHIADRAENDFDIHSQAETRAATEAISKVLELLLLGVAAISLLVGGIGVMNIMLVSVAERTREIGIRMSIGAREGDILLQFLVEAVVLSLIGGVFGMVIGGLSVTLLGRALDWDMTPGAGMAALAVGTSGGIGLAFGYLPARRAAKLDPIDALRVE